LRTARVRDGQAGGHRTDLSTLGETGSQSPLSLEVAEGLWHKTHTTGDPAGPPADALTPGAMLQVGAVGRYRIVREIGRGGMGVVYEAFDIQLQRPVAIKTMRVEDESSAAVRRFLREARIASRLHHPGIMAVHEFGTTDDGHAYMVMGLLYGETLGNLLATRDRGGEDLPRLLAVFLQACQAVAAAHAAGIVHRDLKPANVMVGEYGMVTVMDWGLAKDIGAPAQFPGAAGAAADAPLQQTDHQASLREPRAPGGVSIDDMHTLSGSVFGTPGYLSPEQARGDVAAVDRRADVFGLGGILCEILTGGRPYTADGLAERWRQAREGDLSGAIARLDASVGPMPMIELCRRCLAAAPENRPGHAGELVAACVEYLESGQRRAEQELVRFFDLSADLFCIASLSGYFRRVNDNFPRMLGYSLVDLLSRQFLEFVHPDDRETTVAELQQLSSGADTKQFVNRYRHADGHYLWLEWNARPVPEEGVVYADARDVSDRVQRDLHRQRLEQERQRLAEIVDSAEDAIIGKDLEGTIKSWNRAAERMFGYAAGEMVGNSITALVPPDRLHEERAMRALLREGRRVEAFDTIRVRRDGRRLDVSVAISPIHDAAGTVVGASLIARDIGDRKVLEEALEVSRRDLADFTENANVPLHWVNGQGVIIWANKAELDFLGYTRPEYVGQPITRFHADQTVIEDILTRLSAGQCLSGYEAKLRAKDGSIKNVSIHSSVYSEKGEFRHTRCITVDISAQRQGERVAREQARLAVFVAEVCRMMLRGGGIETLTSTFADMVAAALPASGVRVWLAGNPWLEIARGGDLARASSGCQPPSEGSLQARWTNRPLSPDDVVATRWQGEQKLLGSVEYPLRVDGRTIGFVEAVSSRPIGIAAYTSFGTVCDALSLAVARREDALGRHRGDG